jgi:L-cysteine:1D-myo-inositol 2-amino-2-deoxy-alpha-D-glucopyranoside ligase
MMRLYNSLTNQVQEFVPQGDTISMYVCGITPYDTTHLGHAATYCAFDVLIRFLESRGLIVHYCQNVTDIDDDILRESKKRGRDWIDLGNEWTAHFMRDMIALNVRPPDFYPRATDVIPQIVELDARLIERGVAYASGGSVYFDVDADPSFGELSKIPRAEMLPIANERGNFPDDPKKHDPLDFVLWQAQAPGEPAWDSPWGPGRPGWHIECSTMNYAFFGPTIDLHGGGADLIFPHHECEIAQTTSFTGKDYFARFWMHTAMVGFEGDKMSKSLGNLVMVDQLLQRYTPDSIRLYLGRHHYRTPWEFTYAELDESLSRCTEIAQAASARGGQGSALAPQFARARFERALGEDVNTPEACEVLCQFSDEILAACDERRDVTEAQKWLRQAAGIFGLRLDARQPEAGVIEGWEKHLRRFPVKV